MRRVADRCVLGAWALVLLLAVSVRDARAQPAFDPQEARELVGGWSINWQGARDKYAGRIDISHGATPSELSARVTLLPQSGGTVLQDARITMSGTEIRIECANPRVTGRAGSSWNPDSFYVTRTGREMRGYSVDSAGQRGTLIILTKM